MHVCSIGITRNMHKFVYSRNHEAGTIACNNVVRVTNKESIIAKINNFTHCILGLEMIC